MFNLPLIFFEIARSKFLSISFKPVKKWEFNCFLFLYSQTIQRADGILNEGGITQHAWIEE